MTRFRALTLSLIAHALLIGLLSLWAAALNEPGFVSSLNNLVQIEVKNEDRRIELSLQNETAQDNNLKEALFTAENRSRVKEQKQARFLGQTVNKLFPGLLPKRLFKFNDKTSPALDMGGTLAVENIEPRRKQIDVGISTIQAQLPEQQIKYGDFTALNADQNLFFSFFSRIAPQIRYNWEMGVESAIDSLHFKNLNIQSDKTFATEVEVQLDRDGFFVRTIVTRSAGAYGLDAAVVRAFELSTPFINPPAEMVQDDGLIHLYYVFRVHYSPQIYARP